MKYIFYLLFVSVWLGSCVDNDLENKGSERSDKLGLIATLGSPVLTKAAIVGRELPNGAQIGVSVYKTRNGELYNDRAENIPWTGLSTGWTPSTDILLNDESGTAYAYYPYGREITNLESIPVQLNQTDYCWGSSVERNLSNNPTGTSNATIVFDHALSRVALKVYKKDYHHAVLSKVQIRTLQGKAILCTDATHVTLNAKTGILTGNKPVKDGLIEFTDGNNNAFSSVTLQNEVPLTATASTIVLPTADFETGDLEFVLTINNEEFVVPISKPQSATSPDASGGWKSKYSYTYEVQLTGQQLVTTGASFIAWVDVPVIDMDINNNPNYSYSEDGKFLFYKAQGYEKKIASESTSVEFIMYSNKEVPSSSITASFSKPGIGNGTIQVTSQRLDAGITEIDGEKVLGDWRNKVRIGLNANSNDANQRDVAVTLTSANSRITSFQVQQDGVNTQDLDALLVKMGGLTWMPFNTSGILATDVAIAKGITMAGGIVNYAYASLANWAKVSGTFFKGKTVLAGTVCPAGYRVPALSEYTTLFGSAVPVRPGSIPKWLLATPLDGSHTLPNGVLHATPRSNSLGVMNTYWTFVADGKTLYFVGSGMNGMEGSNVATVLNLGLGIWTSTERSPGNVERISPWDDGWANNATTLEVTAKVRCVKAL